jgi:hypothetical protein
VTDRDVDAGASFTIGPPRDGEPMGGVLGPQPDEVGERSGPQTPEPDQADPGDRIPVDELGLKRGRELVRDDLWVDAVVDEQPALDDATHDRTSHDVSSIL